MTMTRHAVLAMDRTLWPFTIEYCGVQKRLDTKETTEFVSRTQESLRYLRRKGYSVHLATRCTNRKMATRLLDMYYSGGKKDERPLFDSVIFDASEHKLRHLEYIVPNREHPFIFFDSNQTTLRKVNTIYPNALVCHSKNLHEVCGDKSDDLH